MLRVGKKAIAGPLFCEPICCQRSVTPTTSPRPAHAPFHAHALPTCTHVELDTWYIPALCLLISCASCNVPGSRCSAVGMSISASHRLTNRNSSDAHFQARRCSLTHSLEWPSARLGIQSFMFAVTSNVSYHPGLRIVRWSVLACRSPAPLSVCWRGLELKLRRTTSQLHVQKPSLNVFV